MEHRCVVEDKNVMSLFQMVLLDVLIIGGGPHALTLATLLSSTQLDANGNPGHDLAQCATCSTTQSTLEQTGNKCPGQKKKKKKKRRPAAGKVSYLEIK